MAEKLLFADSVKDAVRMKDSGAAFLAGGTEINRLDSTVCAGTLIDIHKIPELKEIKKDKDTVWIGSAVTFQNVVENDIVPAYFKDACLMMASRTKRNMATIGGNIALIRDDSYIIPCLLGAKASVVYCDKDGKETETCICKYSESVANGELEDALILKIGLSTTRKVLNKRYANTAMSHSFLNVSCGMDADGKNPTIGVALKNVGIFRMKCLEGELESGNSLSEENIQSVLKRCDSLSIPDDMYGSKEYKRYLLGTTVAKLISDLG